MDNENNSFIYGIIAGIVSFILILFFIFMIILAEQGHIENLKTEHLTITYKNNKCDIADKEMLVNIMKQHFPTSNWSYVDTEAGKNYVKLDAWRTIK